MDQDARAMEMQAVFCFADDGATFLLYDVSASEADNDALAKLVAVEARRRLKAGQSDAGNVRPRRPGDVIVNETAQTAKAA